MMESQGQPCLKGLPETPPGATEQHDENTKQEESDQFIHNDTKCNSLVLPPKKRQRETESEDLSQIFTKKSKLSKECGVDSAVICHEEGGLSSKETGNQNAYQKENISCESDTEIHNENVTGEQEASKLISCQSVASDQDVVDPISGGGLQEKPHSLDTEEDELSKEAQENTCKSNYASSENLPNSETNFLISTMEEQNLHEHAADANTVHKEISNLGCYTLPEITPQRDGNEGEHGNPIVHEANLSPRSESNPMSCSQDLVEDQSSFVSCSTLEEQSDKIQVQSQETDSDSMAVPCDVHNPRAEAITISHEDTPVESEQNDKPPVTMKLDLEQLQLLNVGGSVEYMETLPTAVVRSSQSTNTVQAIMASATDEKEVPGQQGEGDKNSKLTLAHDAVVFHTDQLSKPANAGGISIQVYPQQQGISLVTPSGILTADMGTFSGQVPTILTEGDVEDSDISATFAEQFQVVTTSSVLAGQTSGTDNLNVMMSSGEFGRGVVLTDQQQVLISSMIVPGMTPGQTLHISLPQTSTASGDGILNTPGPSHSEGCQEDQQNEDTDDKEGPSHVCPVEDCKKVCPRAHRLKLHMLSHTGERPYKCPHEGCEWAFTTAYKLKRHERGHTGERPYMCPQEGCGRRFTTAYNLKTHIRAHSRTNSILCHYEGCDKAFPSMHKFRVHERKHQLEENPYRCEVEGCGKVFTAMGTLTSHLKSHSGERPHGCPVDGCDKRFTKASKLKLHLRSHTGERPFSCDEEGCGWSFTSAYKLKRHKRKHTGERPFVCSYEGCHKSFTRSSHLKTHSLAHTGEKPYICPVDGCKKAFTAGSTLNIHLRKHTGDKPYRCEEISCNKAYTTAANLRAHQKRHDKTSTTSASSKTAESGGEELLHTEYVTVSTVPNAGSLVDSDISTFPPEEFATSEAVSLPVISGHFPPSVIVSSTISGSHDHLAQGVKAVSHILTDSRSKRASEKSSVIPVSNFGQTGEHAVHLGNAVDGGQIDVAEFVVRSDGGDTVLHSPEASGVVTEKLAGGFDLSITSMVSHLRCHPSPDGKLLHSEGFAAQHSGQEGIIVDHKIPIPSRTLEFRSPVNPEDQFAPPAVIFQEDSIKSGSSDTEGESVQQTADLPSPSQAQMQINLPHDVIQIHFRHPSAATHEASVDVETGPEGHQLTSFGSPPMSEMQEDGLNKPEMSSYIDGNISSEQEDAAVDSYPESTINLQDLR